MKVWFKIKLLVLLEWTFGFIWYKNNRRRPEKKPPDIPSWISQSWNVTILNPASPRSLYPSPVFPFNVYNSYSQTPHPTPPHPPYTGSPTAASLGAGGQQSDESWRGADGQDVVTGGGQRLRRTSRVDGTGSTLYLHRHISQFVTARLEGYTEGLKFLSRKKEAMMTRTRKSVLL